ncbi:unnamed protein product [Calypogeia fissa]
MIKQSRFSDAEEEESGPDEPYPAQVSPWNVKTAVTEFARDNPKVKPEALLEWANGIDDEDHAPSDKVVVQGGKFDGSWQWEHKSQAFLAKINNNGVLNNTRRTPPCKAGMACLTTTAARVSCKHCFKTQQLLLVTIYLDSHYDQSSNKGVGLFSYILILALERWEEA